MRGGDIIGSGVSGRGDGRGDKNSISSDDSEFCGDGGGDSDRGDNSTVCSGSGDGSDGSGEKASTSSTGNREPCVDFGKSDDVPRSDFASVAFSKTGGDSCTGKDPGNTCVALSSTGGCDTGVHGELSRFTGVASPSDGFTCVDLLRSRCLVSKDRKTFGENCVESTGSCFCGDEV